MVGSALLGVYAGHLREHAPSAGTGRGGKELAEKVLGGVDNCN